MVGYLRLIAAVTVVVCLQPSGLRPAHGQNTRATATYARIKGQLDAVPAIDTHNHLWPFENLPAIRETAAGRGVNLAGLWRNSYYTWFNKLTPWQDGMQFDDWWKLARNDFADARATSFYRYQLPAFKDLYGVDFEQMTDTEARELDARIFENYRDQHWLYHVVTERANIELMFNDPFLGALRVQDLLPLRSLGLQRYAARPRIS